MSRCIAQQAKHLSDYGEVLLRGVASQPFKFSGNPLRRHFDIAPPALAVD
jgi:hypothetical protein